MDLLDIIFYLMQDYTEITKITFLTKQNENYKN